MALTYTPSHTDLKDLPSFEGSTVFDELYKSWDQPKNRAWVISFLCNHCPYVQAIEERWIQLIHFFNQHYPDKIHFLGICSNDPKDYPEDSPENLKIRAIEKAYPFPYLIDKTQSLAKTFGAVCTPDFFIFNSKGKLTYRGRLDDQWKNPLKVTQEELKNALIKTLKNLPVDHGLPSMGCSIKWI